MCNVSFAPRGGEVAGEGAVEEGHGEIIEMLTAFGLALPHGANIGYAGGEFMLPREGGAGNCNSASLPILILARVCPRTIPDAITKVLGRFSAQQMNSALTMECWGRN